MKPFAVIAVLSLALSACATTGRLDDAQKLALYSAHAGPPVNDMLLFGGLNGWTALGDRALAVWTRPSEAYLLKLRGSCQGLDFASAIGITSQGSRVSRAFDKVLVRDPTGLPQVPCFIDTIQKLDVKALKASEQELRQAQLQEREAAAAPAR
ncbi:DUF6491 family protein [Stenotrophomonas sp. 24(2023)]|uniref:DUF6491 family protein n=1 Tax=Stenotrophomonas sp. 24(2023) TaxID=3068324 RepID=UPI0027E1B89F|nr:DUF6491 family protein [Stenotrophomonas sp. 24(2023)]WMJ68773.1 DUF6491 family protein [Stenotrophomonas sp. 24(2023)]